MVSWVEGAFEQGRALREGLGPLSEAGTHPRGRQALEQGENFLGSGPFSALGRDRAWCDSRLVGSFVHFNYFWKGVISPVIRGLLWLSPTSSNTNKFAPLQTEQPVSHDSVMQEEIRRLQDQVTELGRRLQAAPKSSSARFRSGTERRAPSYHPQHERQT
jgi:hypothetical protein